MKAAKRKRAATAAARSETVAAQDVAAPVETVAAQEVVVSVEADAAQDVAVPADSPVAECPAPQPAAHAEPPPAEAAAGEVMNDAASSAPAVAADAAVVTLNANCTIKDAAALKQSLCAVVNNDTPVTIDVRGVERIDTASIQVLCAFAKQRIAAAHGIVWLGVTDALREAVNLLGVRDMLKLPEGGAA